jgi:hypothetical protein
MPHEPLTAHLARVAAAAALLAALCAPPAARAVPIHYEFQTFSAPASGSLGGVPFAGANLLLTFDGDTADVIRYSVPGPRGPVTGAEILKGTATVTVYQAGVVVGSATFLPSAGIYVSVDQTNSGIGSGSFGKLPGDPGFPGEPVYPVAEFTSTGAVATYDLTTANAVVGFEVSCVGFATPAACAPALPLPTTSGDLLVDYFSPGNLSIFRATFPPPPVVPFASMTVPEVDVNRSLTAYALQGTFRLGAGSNGIDPAGEGVTFTVGPYQATIQPGWLQPNRHGDLVWSGVVQGANLRARFSDRGNGRWTFSLKGSNAPLGGLTDPPTVTLTIGDDTGSDTAPLGD